MKNYSEILEDEGLFRNEDFDPVLELEYSQKAAIVQSILEGCMEKKLSPEAFYQIVEIVFKALDVESSLKNG